MPSVDEFLDGGQSADDFLDSKQPYNFGADLKQSVKELPGAIARTVTNGAFATSNALADATTGAINLVRGKNADGQYPMQMPSEAYAQMRDRAYGAPPSRAEGITEDLLGGILSGKVGLPGAPAAEAVPQTLRSAQVQGLQNAGVTLDAAQQSGSRVARTLKVMGQDAPFSGESELPAKQAGQFTKAVLDKIGAGEADSASPEVMQAVRQRLKDTYNDVAKRYAIKFDPEDFSDPLTAKIRDLRWSVDKNLTEDNAKVIKNQLDEIEAAGKQGGVINGQRYASIQQDLDKVDGQGGKGQYVTDIRQAMTDALRRAAKPSDVRLLAKTDQEYGAMKQIQKAIGSDNQVSPSLLYNAMDTVSRANQSVYGQGANQALFRLAQAGKAIMGNPANSGTTLRAAAQAAIPVAMGAVGELADGHTGGIIGVAAALGGPPLARAISENPRAAAAFARWMDNKRIRSVSDLAKFQRLEGRAGTAGGLNMLGHDPDTASQPTPETP